MGNGLWSTIQVHEKTDKRGTWAYHCVDGWYLNTSPDHYRVHNCHIKTTKQERLSDTVQFKHKHSTNPALTPQDKIMQALANCKAALLGSTNHLGDNQMNDIQQIITNISNNHQQKQPAVPRVHNKQPIQRVPNTDTGINKVNSYISSESEGAPARHSSFSTKNGSAANYHTTSQAQSSSPHSNIQH